MEMNSKQSMAKACQISEYPKGEKLIFYSECNGNLKAKLIVSMMYCGSINHCHGYFMKRFFENMKRGKKGEIKMTLTI